MTEHELSNIAKAGVKQHLSIIRTAIAELKHSLPEKESHRGGTLETIDALVLKLFYEYIKDNES